VSGIGTNGRRKLQSNPHVDDMSSCNATKILVCSLNLILHKQLYRMASTKKVVWYVWTATKL